jgi:cell division protein FtsL
MSLGTVVFMLGIIALITTLLIYYITIQAEVKRTSQEIAEMEEELTQIRAENDAAYNEINDSISLEEVRKRAIQDLGMKYADRDQVIIYTGTEKDSVHQVSSLNDR